MTHTYVILDISAAAYTEIATRLRAADYHHVFHHTSKGAVVIDMHGIALRMEEDTVEAMAATSQSDAY